MTGNQGVGVQGGGASVESVEIDLGGVSSAPAAVAETIYVGRASFRVAHDVENTPAIVLAASTDTTPWFRPLGSNYEQTAIVSMADRWKDEASSHDGVPRAHGAESGSVPLRRGFSSSPWTIGLPLTFGAFFCGLLISPLASSSFSRREKNTVPASTVVAPAAVPSARPAAPAPAPVVAPITPIEPARPRQLNLVAAATGSRAAASSGGTLVPVQGRAMKNVLRKPSAPRRLARKGAMPSDSSSSASDTAPAVKHAWVDPWAGN